MMAPIMFYAYVHLARVEEQRAEAEFGELYRDYVEITPPFSTLQTVEDFFHD